MATALVKALAPHWKSAPEYQLTFTELLLKDDLDAVSNIKKGLHAGRSLKIAVMTTHTNTRDQEGQ